MDARGFGGPLDVFLTRLHVRYDAAHFPEDLVFQETGDRTNFQGRYVLRHPWTGGDTCEAATQYRSSLPARLEKEAQTLASLTGCRRILLRDRTKEGRQEERAAAASTGMNQQG